MDKNRLNVEPDLRTLINGGEYPVAEGLATVILKGKKVNIAQDPWFYDAWMMLEDEKKKVQQMVNIYLSLKGERSHNDIMAHIRRVVR